LTIVAAVKTRDCLVLGTDSVESVFAPAEGGQLRFLKTYTHTPKLFHLREYAIGVASWGLGNIGERSVAGLVADFGDTLPQQAPSLQDTAMQFHKFIDVEYGNVFSGLEDSKKPVLGFFIGGYARGQSLSELWEVRFPGKALVSLVRKQSDYGANWRGIEIPFTRLHFGFDPRLRERLLVHGMKDEEISAMLNDLQMPVVFDSMPSQSAVDYCRHILKTTINVSKYEVGVAVCGEPLQVALITRNRFNWVEELKSE
jgi:hypothetical protein